MVPLIGALLPLIPTIIQGVESLFSKKPKSGDEKMSTVLSSLREIAVKLVANGLGDKQPTDDELRGVIEAVFQQMKSGGTVATGNVQYYLLQGTVQQLPPMGSLVPTQQR